MIDLLSTIADNALVYVLVIVFVAIASFNLGLLIGFIVVILL
jgi:hypothetical protein